MSIEPLNAAGKELLSLASVCAPNFAIPDALLADSFGGSAREDEFGTALRELLCASLLTRRSDKVSSVFIHPLVSATATQLLHSDRLTFRQRVADSLLSRISAAHDIRTHSAIADDIHQARQLGDCLEDEWGVRLTSLLGRYERARGSYAAAAALETNGLSLAKRVLLEEHPLTLTIINGLANSLQLQGNLGSARTLYEQLLMIRLRLHGEEDPDTLISMTELAGALREQGDLSAAGELQERQLTLIKRKLGEEHPFTLTSMCNLAEIRRRKRNLHGARSLQERALPAMRRLFGEQHPDTLTLMNNYAGTLHGLGDLSAARAPYEQALPISLRIRGDDHPSTLNLISNLSLVMLALGDVSGSRALQEKGLPTSRRRLGGEHPITTRLAWNLCSSLYKLEEYASAQAAADDNLQWLIDRDPVTLSAEERQIREHVLQMKSLLYQAAGDFRRSKI